MNLRDGIRSIALLAALTIGCAPLPSAPRLSAPELPASEAARRPVDSGVVLQPSEPLPGSDTLVYVQPVEGSTGGRVTVGLVRIDVPSGAYAGDAEIHVRVPDSLVLEVDLEILPASKNSFSEPVDLTFDLAATRFPADQKIFWLDESSGQWVEVPSTYDSSRKTLVSRLSHFSVYKVAKASWAKASWGVAP